MNFGDEYFNNTIIVLVRELCEIKLRNSLKDYMQHVHEAYNRAVQTNNEIYFMHFQCDFHTHYKNVCHEVTFDKFCDFVHTVRVKHLNHLEDDLYDLVVHEYLSTPPEVYMPTYARSNTSKFRMNWKFSDNTIFI